MFTKRHYKAIARIISRYDIAQVEMLIDDFCKFFEADNPNFDGVRFTNACYYYEEENE